MGIAASIVSAVLKSVVGDKLGNGLIKELSGISIDGISEKSINEITDFINKGKSKIDNILSKGNSDYVVAEIKYMLSRIKITDEVLRQCKYDSMNLSALLWNEFYKNKDGYIECESDIKRCLFTIAEALIKLVRESENFEKDVLIHISNYVDAIKSEEQITSQIMVKRFDMLEEKNQEILNRISVNYDLQSKNIEQKKVKSRTQEYADKWNENMFLNNFDKRDQNAGINVKLGEVYLEEHLPHYIWHKNNENDPSKDLKELLSEYINGKSDSKMLLILGQPGIGKSTLITWISANFMERFDDILVYRFASDFGNIDWNDGRISNRILESLCLNYDDLKGKTLILDGFDEVSIEANRRKDILDNLYGDWIKNKIIENFSLIITCRENYVSQFAILKCKYITLQPWDEKQIRSFCGVFQEKTNQSVSLYTIKKLLENKEILGIPLILYMVLALNISIEKEGSIVDVYDEIFSLNGGIYDRCIDNKMFANQHRISKIKQQIHQISREIAVCMFENHSDEASISYDEYEGICYAVARAQDKDSVNIEQDVKIGNFFKSVNHCEGVETEELCFVHRSIYEYFVAETIFVSMQESINISKEMLACIWGKLLKKGNLSKNILDYLKQKIEKSKIVDRFDIIQKTFQLMLQNGMTYYTGECYKNVFDCEMNVFANVLEVIHLWDNNVLEFDNSIFNFIKYREDRQLNLSFIDWRGKNLENIDLSNTNLSYANLKNANLKGANLEDVNLKNAILVGVSFQGVILDKVKMYGVIARPKDFFGAIYDGNVLDKKFFQGINVDIDFSGEIS